MEDKASNLPTSLCCAVSADGLRLVIPQTNKFMVYQAGETKPVEFSANVQVFPKVAGSDEDDYAASHRNFGYPGIVWLDSNRFMFAKSHPMQWKVDADGSHADTNNNGLAIYDLTTGAINDLSRTSMVSVKWFTVDGNSLILAVYKSNVSGLVDENSGLIIYEIQDYTNADSQLLELALQDDFQSTIAYSFTTKQLYIQPTGAIVGTPTYGSNNVIQRLNVSTGEEGTVTIKGLGSYPSIEGVIGPDKLVVNNSIGANNNYNIYDVQSGLAEHIFSFDNN